MDIDQLPSLGAQLSALRKQNFPQDTQQDFALRIGVSKGTYLKMEKGLLSISMASYYAAAVRHGIQARFNELFIPLPESKDLFQAAQNQKRPNK